MGNKKLTKEAVCEGIVWFIQKGIIAIKEGVILMANPAALDILGIDNKYIGKPYYNFMIDDIKNDSFHEVITDTIFSEKQVNNYLVKYIKADKEINLSVTTSYIDTEDGKVVLVIANDVTELYELERITKLNVQLEEAKKEAELANEAKSRFLSSMSHEIRTPINAVLGMNEMILREYDDPQLIRYASNIESSGKTLLFLINDILDMSKIESGKMDVVPAEYRLDAIINDLWNIIVLRAREKGLEINFHISDGVPSKLFGDDVRIKQVITNILTNAVKYTPKGNIRLNVEYEKTGSDSIILIISVRDTGIGIKKEDMGRLFESFRRIDEQRNRNIEGTGLGMSISMALIKLMDGELNVESEYQKGSVFTVRLPQKVLSWEAIGSFEEIQKNFVRKKKSNKAAFTAPDAKLLVVDDNQMNLNVIQGLLKRTKAGITAVLSGREALSLIQKEKYHIIFMDHLMPEMDGIETLHEIKKLDDSPNYDTPVIILTANALAGAKELYLKEGFSDFLPKPIDADKLEEMVYSYLPEDICMTGDADNQTDGNDEECKNKDNSVSHISETLSTYGISLEKGLGNVRNDFNAYKELTHIFCSDSDNRRGKMEQFILRNDMKNYAILVHALKGDARILGADTLADIAYEHECKSKEQDAEYVSSNWNSLISEWDKALSGFKTIEDNAQNGTDSNAENVNKPVLPEKTAYKLIKEIIEKIDNFESESASVLIRGLMAYKSDKDFEDALACALRALEDEFDEDKAIEILKNMLN